MTNTFSRATSSIAR
jgi:hypothetical protein